MFARFLGIYLVVTFITATLITSVAIANPVDMQVELNGYSSYPVLQCPAANEAIKDFRTKLLQLKAAIKSEANCSGISADVTGLANLVTNQRDEIIALINKGQSEGLSTNEQGKVEAYVQQLTEKTSNLISVITGNDACFDEDKKGMSLEFITSLIGEGSKILSVIGGPQVGATIQVAGEVITGFLKAMKTVQENRQGYRFDKPDQRMAYAESLCSLFDYRRELERLIDPFDSIARLRELNSVLTRQISLLKSNCSECAELIVIVEQEIAKARAMRGGDQFKIEDVWPAAFEQRISKRAAEIDQMYTRRLGTHTYRSLKTLTWLPLRIKALEDRNLRADLGLQDVLSEMESIEKFMVTEQAQYFLRHLIFEAADWREKVVGHVASGRNILYQLRYAYPAVQINLVNNGDVNAYYGSILESLEVARDQVGTGQRSLIRTYFSDLERMARSLNIAVEVTNNYCNFFAEADWYRNGIHKYCGGNALQDLQDAAWRFSDYRSMMPSAELVMHDVVVGGGPEAMFGPVTVTQDWVESLTRVVEDMTNSQEYIRRQQQDPVDLLLPMGLPTNIPH